MHIMCDTWCMWSAVVCTCFGILAHLPERFSGQSPPPCQVAAVLAGYSLGAVDQTWHDGRKRPPKKISPLHPLRWESLSLCTHTIAHMHHASCIMCIVTVWHLSIGNIIPILGYITLDTPVTVVTSGELWNWNQAVSETKTWQLYGALVVCVSSIALITSTTIIGMFSIKFWTTAVSMASYSLCVCSHSSLIPLEGVGYAVSCLLRWTQRCLIGLRSGDWAGQSMT